MCEESAEDVQRDRQLQLQPQLPVSGPVYNKLRPTDFFMFGQTNFLYSGPDCLNWRLCTVVNLFYILYGFRLMNYTFITCRESAHSVTVSTALWPSEVYSVSWITETLESCFSATITAS